ncbi:membrane protein [Pseudidiomarina atlantica]|jgi:ABC-2 type transport system permease protein|uniref:Membrane protein n=1 Tax=Pseudidiomarina atlantica TaxID=1517416 RepID=A0A094INL2_9GAMM|nr:ABC transporter permease [Pseudidiomarina atlantica]KFZ28722.1 membrane protein [Pseudidiomarina atlantica]
MRLRTVAILGWKELQTIVRDPILLLIVVVAFSVSVYTAASAMPDTLHKTPIAVIDDDQSQLSQRIVQAFREPYFLPPESVSYQLADQLMDQGRYTFIVHIPSHFQRDFLAGNATSIQVLVDATRMTQAFTGSGYLQVMIQQELQAVMGTTALPPIELNLRSRFNPELNAGWFSAVNEVISQITMLSIILTGAALLREREHGTIEHLLVMPISAMEIMAAKVWSMALVVMIAALASLVLVVQTALEIPLAGSLSVFTLALVLHLFATTSLGIFLASFARSMPQFGLLLMLVILPMEILSGGMTPRESLPPVVYYLMSAAPTTHFIEASQAILFRGAGLSLVTPQIIALAIIGTLFFAIAHARFRRALTYWQ